MPATPDESKITARPSFATLADNARERLRAAQLIADGCRYDGALHRATMKAVFVLEDTLFALLQLADAAKPPGARAIGPFESRGR